MNYNTIYNEHCKITLNRLEDNSIHCIITSPPYWGLRDYGLEPLIWDGDNGCVHEWDTKEIKWHSGTNVGEKQLTVGGAFHNNYKTQSAYCVKCGAWHGSLGLEPTPELYVKHLTDIFKLARQKLRKDGSLWLNLGDSYAGSGCGTNDYRTEKSRSINKSDKMFSKKPPQQKYTGLKPKDLCMIPAKVAMSLQADGWYLRSDIIWSKPNPMPESVKDRPTKAHEYIFLLSKSAKYYYDADAIKEKAKDLESYSGRRQRYNLSIENNQPENANKMRGYKENTGKTYKLINKRSVWEINTQPFPEAHFAVFPEKLVEPCILAGCPENGIVYDPFMGAGTVAKIALRANRQFVGSELNIEYINIANKRIEPLLTQTTLL